MIRKLSNSGSDLIEWIGLWERTGHEPYAHPSYVGLFLRTGDEAQALIWQDQKTGSWVLLPFIRRPLAVEEWTENTILANLWTDAISPYGYGGPFADSEDVSWHLFWIDVVEWMQADQVITFFIRTSLQNRPPELLDGLEAGCYEVLNLSENIIVDVQRTKELQWSHYEHKVRKNVKKAEKAELRVEIHDHFDNLDAFLDIYHSTMQRRSASEWYFFERPFFQTFVDSLVGSYIVAEVYNSINEMVSTELILKSDRFVYSYLGGTLREAFIHAPNDLLKHAVIDYARSHAKEGYVLGGGYEPDDGIFRYKKAFDVDGVVPFFGICLTASPQVYRSMSEHRLTTARTQTPDVVLQTHFFPQYRAPLTSGVALSNE